MALLILPLYYLGILYSVYFARTTYAYIISEGYSNCSTQITVHVSVVPNGFWKNVAKMFASHRKFCSYDCFCYRPFLIIIMRIRQISEFPWCETNMIMLSVCVNTLVSLVRDRSVGTYMLPSFMTYSKISYISGTSSSRLT